MTTTCKFNFLSAILFAAGMVILAGGWAIAGDSVTAIGVPARPDAVQTPFALPPLFVEPSQGTLATLGKFTSDGGNLPDSAGYEFYLASTPNYYGGYSCLLVLTSKLGASATVTVPAISFSESMTVPAGGLATLTIPASAMINSFDTVIPGMAIHIVADNEVTAYLLEPETPVYTNDGMLGLPTDILGTQYYVLTWYNGYMNGYFVVLGTQDDTTVTITPSNIATKTPGVPYQITLGAGDVYALNAGGSSNVDISGTLVTSDKPVAVIGGHQCANIPMGYGYCDFLTEMLFPVQTWGRHYLVTPFDGPPQNGDVLRLIAAYDNTEVTINGSVAATLDAGQVYEEIPFTTARVISSNKPIMVAQYLTGSSFGGSGGLSDPSMCLIPPTEQYLNEYVFLNLPYFTQQYVKMIAPESATGTCEVDGSPISGWTGIEGTGYSTLDWPLSSGAHAASCALPFGIEVVGYYQDTSYAYPGGLALVNLLGVALIADETLFEGPGTVTLTAIVNDDEGNPRVGIPVDFEVTAGPNEGETGSDVTDETGEATWSYYGNQMGTDTVIASFLDGETYRQSNQVIINWAFVDFTPPTVVIHMPKRQKLMWAQGMFRKLTFTVKDDTGSVREGVWVDRCLAYDGDLFGDQDGILRDEYIYIDQSHLLCQAYRRCGIKRWNNPVITVTAEDMVGNLGWDKIFIGGRYTVNPSRCR